MKSGRRIQNTALSKETKRTVSRIKSTTNSPQHPLRIKINEHRKTQDIHPVVGNSAVPFSEWKARAFLHEPYACLGGVLNAGAIS